MESKEPKELEAVWREASPCILIVKQGWAAPVGTLRYGRFIIEPIRETEIDWGMRFTQYPFRKVFLLNLFFLVAASWAAGTSDDARLKILGESVLENGAYTFLEHLSDQFGPRMIGTEGHREAMDHLERELNALGIETRRQAFAYPGWVRGEARVDMTAPFQRQLRVAALGYVGTFRNVRGPLAYVDSGEVAELDAAAIRDRILLVRQNVTFSHEAMLALAAEHGVRGMLYINRKEGGQLLARTANREGEPTPFPVFSLSQEEGLWMQRMLDSGRTVELKLETTSRVEEWTGINLIATIPGRSGESVLVGGHFDSWDLGQGAIDNGLAVAQLFETARLLKKHSPDNRHTVELVWFDAEEFGLWGSRHYAEAADLSGVRAVLNLDMVGRPIAVNAMGFDSLVPRLEDWVEGLGAWTFTRQVANVPWLGSDHHPFILNGVPAITFNAPLDPEDVRYYHDFADTFDKVDRVMLAESTAMTALLVHHLANSTEPKVPHLSVSETAELFRKAGLEERMRKAGRWPFGDPE